MRSKIIGLAALAVGLILVAGCINYDQELTLNPDGSGTIEIRYDSSAQKPGGEKTDLAADVPLLAFTEDDINAEYEGTKLTVRDIVIGVLEGSEETPEAQYFLDFKNLTDLNGHGVFALEGDKLKQTFSLTPDGDNMAFKQIVEFNMEVEEDQLSSLESFKFTYKLNAPGAIVECNGTASGNTAEWEYTLDKLVNKQTELTATYEGGAAGGGSKVAVIVGIIICVIIIIVIIIVIIVLLTKKKKKPAAPKSTGETTTPPAGE